MDFANGREGGGGLRTREGESPHFSHSSRTAAGRFEDNDILHSSRRHSVISLEGTRRAEIEHVQ